LIAFIIIATEIAFWVVLLSGLTARYVLRRPRLGALLLVATPLVDLVLLGFTVLDLSNGATASVAHALAAIYIGVSLAFGHSLVQWADARFAHRFAGGPAPQRAPRSDRAHAAHARRGWRRHLLAWAIGVSLLLGAVAVVADAGRTEALLQTAGTWTLILVIDFLISFSYTLFPRPEDGEPGSQAEGAAPSGSATALRRSAGAARGSGSTRRRALPVAPARSESGA